MPSSCSFPILIPLNISIHKTASCPKNAVSKQWVKSPKKSGFLTCWQVWRCSGPRRYSDKTDIRDVLYEFELLDASTATLFTSLYDLSEVQAGLIFLPFGVGSLIGAYCSENLPFNADFTHFYPIFSLVIAYLWTIGSNSSNLSDRKNNRSWLSPTCGHNIIMNTIGGDDLTDSRTQKAIFRKIWYSIGDSELCTIRVLRSEMVSTTQTGCIAIICYDDNIAYSHPSYPTILHTILDIYNLQSQRLIPFASHFISDTCADLRYTQLKRPTSSSVVFRRWGSCWSTYIPGRHGNRLDILRYLDV